MSSLLFNNQNTTLNANTHPSVSYSHHLLQLTNDGCSWIRENARNDRARISKDDELNRIYLTNPIQVHSIESPVIKLSESQHISFALTQSHQVFVKGKDVQRTGVLGLGESVFEAKEYTLLASLSSKKIQQISLGVSHAAALDDEGNLYLWGSGSNGQLAKLNSSSDSVAEVMQGLPSLVTEFSGNVKEVFCSSSATSILTKNEKLYVFGHLIDKQQQSSSSKTAASLWERKPTKKAVPTSLTGKQKNQIQFGWQVFVKIIAIEDAWGGCALTKKGDIVFFNKHFKAEKINGRSNILDAFVAKDRLFALAEDGLLDWDLGFILKNGFFTTGKQSSLDRQLDVKYYPPKSYLFSSAVCSTFLVPSTDHTSAALSVKTTPNGEIFSEKSSLISLGVGGLNGATSATNSLNSVCDPFNFNRLHSNNHISGNPHGLTPSRYSHTFLQKDTTSGKSPLSTRLTNNLEGFNRISLRQPSNGLKGEKLSSKPIRFNTEESSNLFFGKSETSKLQSLGGYNNNNNYSELRGLSNTSNNRGGFNFNPRNNAHDNMSTLKSPSPMLSPSSRFNPSSTLPRTQINTNNTFDSKWQSLKPQLARTESSTSQAPQGKDLNYFLNLIQSGKQNNLQQQQQQFSQKNLQPDLYSNRDHSLSTGSFLQPSSSSNFRANKQSETISLKQHQSSKSPFQSSLPIDRTNLLQKQASGSFLSSYKSLIKENEKLTLDHSSISNNNRSFQTNNTFFGTKKQRNLLDALNTSSTSSQPKFHFIDAAGSRINIPSRSGIHVRQASSSISPTPRRSSYRSNSQINILSESMQMNQYHNLKSKSPIAAGGFEKAWSALNKSIDISNQQNALRNSRINRSFNQQQQHSSPLRSHSNRVLPSPSPNRSFHSERRLSPHQASPGRRHSFIEGIVDPKERDPNYFDSLKRVDPNKLYSSSSSPAKRSYRSSLNGSPNRMSSSPRFHGREGAFNHSFDANMSMNSQNLFKSRRGSFGAEHDEQNSRLQNENHNKIPLFQAGTAGGNQRNKGLDQSVGRATVSVGNQTLGEDEKAEYNKAAAEANQKIGYLQSQLNETINENQKLKAIINQSERQSSRSRTRGKQSGIASGGEDSKQNNQTGGDISDGSLIDLSCSDIFDDDDNPIYSDQIDPSTLSPEDQIKRKRREERRANKLLASSGNNSVNGDEDSQKQGRRSNQSSKPFKESQFAPGSISNKIDNLTSISESLKNYPMDDGTTKSNKQFNAANSPTLSGKYTPRDAAAASPMTWQNATGGQGLNTETGGEKEKRKKTQENNAPSQYEINDEFVFNYGGHAAERDLERVFQEEGFNDDLNAQLERDLLLELQQASSPNHKSNLQNNLNAQNGNNKSRSSSPNQIFANNQRGNQAAFSDQFQQPHNQTGVSRQNQLIDSQGNAVPYGKQQYPNNIQRKNGNGYASQDGFVHGSEEQEEYEENNDFDFQPGTNQRNQDNREEIPYQNLGSRSQGIQQQQGEQFNNRNRSVSPNQNNFSRSQTLSQGKRSHATSQDRLSSSIGLPPSQFQSNRSQNLRHSLPVQSIGQRSKSQLNKSNTSLNNSRSSNASNRRSTSNTPKRSGSLRYSDICNGFNNQMKKSHFIEQTKAIERASGTKISQYSDPNSSMRKQRDTSVVSNRSLSGSRSPNVYHRPGSHQPANVLPTDISRSSLGKSAELSSPSPKKKSFEQISPISKHPQQVFFNNPQSQNSQSNIQTRSQQKIEGSQQPKSNSSIKEQSPLREQHRRSNSNSRNPSSSPQRNQMNAQNQQSSFGINNGSQQKLSGNNLQSRQVEKILTIDDLASPESRNSMHDNLDDLVQQKREQIAIKELESLQRPRFSNPDLFLQSSNSNSVMNLSPIQKANNSQNLGFSGVNIYSQLTALQPMEPAQNTPTSSQGFPPLFQVNDLEYKQLRENSLQQVNQRKSERDDQAANFIRDSTEPTRQSELLKHQQQHETINQRNRDSSNKKGNVYQTYAEQNPKLSSSIGKDIPIEKFLEQTSKNEAIREQIHSDKKTADRKQLQELTSLKDTLTDQGLVNIQPLLAQQKKFETQSPAIENLIQQQLLQATLPINQAKQRSPLKNFESTLPSRTVPSTETDDDNQRGHQLRNSEPDENERAKKQSNKAKNDLKETIPFNSNKDSNQKLSFLDYKVKEGERKIQRTGLLNSKSLQVQQQPSSKASLQNNSNNNPDSRLQSQQSQTSIGGQNPQQKQQTSESEGNIFSQSQQNLQSLIAKQKALQSQPQTTVNPSQNRSVAPQAQQAVVNLFNKEKSSNQKLFDESINGEQQTFKKASQNSKICIVLAMKAEKFQLKRKSFAFQTLKLFTQLSKKNAQMQQQLLSSSKSRGLSSSSNLQQVAKAAIIVVIKTMSKLLLRTKQQAFDELKYSQCSLRPTIEPNQRPIIKQSNAQIEQAEPQTPERKSRRDFSSKQAQQQRPTSDSPQRLAFIQQKARASQQTKPNPNQLESNKDVMNPASNSKRISENQKEFAIQSSYQSPKLIAKQKQAQQQQYQQQQEQQQQQQQKQQRPEFHEEQNENEPSFRCLENSNQSAQFVRRSSPPVSRNQYYQNGNYDSHSNMNRTDEEDNSYRPQHSPTYADPKEFEPDTFAPKYHKNLSQDEIQLFEELQQHHLMQSRQSASGGGGIRRPKSNDFNDNDLYTQLPPRETHNAQFERYLSQFDQNLSQANPYADRLSFPSNENYMYEIEDDGYVHRGDNHQNTFTQQQTSEYIMKMLNQSQQYALLPENLQPGHVHKEKYRDLQVHPITDYAQIRKSALSDKKLNEQSLRNPPAQFLPGYEQVIHAQKQFIGKKFKTMHNQQVTGKELSMSPNNTFRMNNSTFQSPSRHMQSSQSLQQINLSSSRLYKSPNNPRFTQSRQDSRQKLDASTASYKPQNIQSQKKGNQNGGLRAKTPKN